MALKYLTFILFFHTFKCQLEFSDDQFNSRDVGAKCFLSNGQSGFCSEIKNCDNLKESFSPRLRPTVCSYNFEGPIICCANSERNNESKDRVSVSKCNEYKTLSTVSTRSRITPKGLYFVTVVGGQSVISNEFPHMAALGFKLENDAVDWKCGASLISENFVLTAAHCTAFGNDKPDIVRISDRDLFTASDDIEEHVQERTIKEMHIHPKYKITSYYHDIALLELSEPINISPNLRPACLWTSDYIDTKSVWATGWGLTKFTGTPSEELLKVELELYDEDDYYTGNSNIKPLATVLEV
uniref:CSON010334 protein n=1 Tax=Culicoides sonorensis TaxID=179676 RepID=A0A336M5H6_CULSO